MEICFVCFFAGNDVSKWRNGILFLPLRTQKKHIKGLVNHSFFYKHQNVSTFSIKVLSNFFSYVFASKAVRILVQIVFYRKSISNHSKILTNLQYYLGFELSYESPNQQRIVMSISLLLYYINQWWTKLIYCSNLRPLNTF